MVFLEQYFFHKAMKTNAFSILLFPRASNSNENRCFFNTFARQSFKKAMKAKADSMLLLPRVSKSNEGLVFFILLAPSCHAQAGSKLAAFDGRSCAGLCELV